MGRCVCFILPFAEFDVKGKAWTLGVVRVSVKPLMNAQKYDKLVQKKNCSPYGEIPLEI